MAKHLQFLCFTTILFIFNFCLIFCALDSDKKSTSMHNRTYSDPAQFIDVHGNEKSSSSSCEGQKCSKENYFLLKVCHFLAYRSIKNSSEYAIGSPGSVLLNPAKQHWRCVKFLNGMLTGSERYPQMDKWLQFRFKPQDGQTNTFLGTILIGGPLLTKLNIYDTKIEYHANFFNILLREVLYNEGCHAKMVDKLLILTTTTKWPNVLTQLVPMDTVMKLSQWDTHVARIRPHVVLTVNVRVKPRRGYGVVYTVERNGTAQFKIGLFNDPREQQQQQQRANVPSLNQQQIEQFVLFVVEKVGPGLINEL